MIRASRLSIGQVDRAVRREAKLLLKEARAGLRRRGGELSDDTKRELDQRTAALEQACGQDDPERIRAATIALDGLVDKLSLQRKSTVREYAESIGIAVLIALLLRAFVVEAFKIPSTSMVPTMEVGDHIFVNKFLYGVRIPYTKTKFFQWRKPQRGEVIVFINPCTPEKDFIKRIVATAGDTVEVRCSVVYVNGEAVAYEPVPGECSYLDENQDPKSCTRWAERVHDTRYEIFLFENQVPGQRGSEPRKSGFPEIDSSPRRLLDKSDFSNLVPSCKKHCGHTQCDRDPDELPPPEGRVEQVAPGARLDPDACYQQLRYVVPEGRVFVMGDNRENSSDSREWGVVPLENIKGKALFIWWSAPRGSGFDKIRWGRIGKVVE